MALKSMINGVRFVDGDSNTLIFEIDHTEDTIEVKLPDGEFWLADGKELRQMCTKLLEVLGDLGL